MFKTSSIKSYLSYLFTFLVVVVVTPVNALDQNAIIKKIQALQWQVKPGTYQLEGANSSVTITLDEYLLLGKEAYKYMRLSQGYDGLTPDAVIARIDDTQIVFTYHDIGFVKMDDWEEHIDKDELLSEIQKSTEAANKVKKASHSKMYIDGWAQEPYLDKKNAIVYWAISAHSSGGESIVNAKAIKLGRKGFESIVWIGEPKQFTSTQTALLPALAKYKYNLGFKYDDYVESDDTVSFIGVGALAHKLILGKAVTKNQGDLLAKNTDISAVDSYRKLCNAGNAEGCFGLGWHYYYGKDVIQNYSKAIELYKKSCKANNSKSCRSLGRIYRDGKGLKINNAKAIEFFLRSCNQDDAGGCSDAAVFYVKGKGEKKNYSKAIKLFNKACDHGYSLACSNLGFLYQKGDGVKQDNEKAYQLYKKSCDGNYPEGCYRLGTIYQTGKGVKQDNKKAHHFYEKACEDNYPVSCHRLGAIFQNGKSVKKNHKHAKVFFSKACKLGSQLSCMTLNELNEETIVSDFHFLL